MSYQHRNNISTNMMSKMSRGLLLRTPTKSCSLGPMIANWTAKRANNNNNNNYYKTIHNKIQKLILKLVAQDNERSEVPKTKGIHHPRSYLIRRRLSSRL